MFQDMFLMFLVDTSQITRTDLHEESGRCPSMSTENVTHLADAPVYLQRMLLRLQDYDFTIKYCPGEEMVVADTLLRYSPEDIPEIPLDISINHINVEKT